MHHYNFLYFFKYKNKMEGYIIFLFYKHFTWCVINYLLKKYNSRIYVSSDWYIFEDFYNMLDVCKMPLQIIKRMLYPTRRTFFCIGNETRYRLIPTKMQRTQKHPPRLFLFSYITKIKIR